jgi:hypothetical protein
MEILKQLPEIVELDVEFSKSASVIFDIFITNMNKRLKIINTLRDDILDYVKKCNLINSIKIEKYTSSNYIFPKVNKEKNWKDFPSDLDDFWFASEIYIESIKDSDKSFGIQMRFDLKNIYLHFGQWGDKNEIEFFSFEYLSKFINDLKSKNINEIIQIVIEHPNISPSSDGKYITFEIPLEKIDNKDVLLNIYDNFKNHIVKKGLSDLEEYFFQKD